MSVASPVLGLVLFAHSGEFRQSLKWEPHQTPTPDIPPWDTYMLLCKSCRPRASCLRLQVLGFRAALTMPGHKLIFLSFPPGDSELVHTFCKYLTIFQSRVYFLHTKHYHLEEQLVKSEQQRQ